MGIGDPNNIYCMDSHIAFGKVLHKRFLRETKHGRDAAGMDIQVAEREAANGCKYLF